MRQSRRKRQHQNQSQGYDGRLQERQRQQAVLHIQAHEADIVHGATAKARAASLEVGFGGNPSARTALIKLEASPTACGQASSRSWEDDDDDNVFSLSVGSSNARKMAPTSVSASEVWVDRYDARLLFDSFTGLALDNDASLEPVSPSPSSWSDFPEDSRETFLLSQTQSEDYHRSKRRRFLDEAYERRLNEREAEDRDDRDKDQVVLDDGELSPEALLLMQRTANHLLSATNPAQLEMRILANHGADRRFSFLRDGGKWNAVWLDVKAKLNAEKEREKEAAAKAEVKGLGGLAGYGSDSDSSEGEGCAPSPPSIRPPPLPDAGGTTTGLDSKAEILKRRARAREWMLSRKGDKQDST